jgi:hypothetical protein
MATDERPSWLGDTLTGDPEDSLEQDVDNLSAAVDHLQEMLERFVAQSDRPPPDDPPAAAAMAA